MEKVKLTDKGIIELPQKVRKMFGLEKGMSKGGLKGVLSCVS